MNRIKIDIWVDADKGSCWDAGKEAGLSDEAAGMFRYAANEHKITYLVDVATGKAEAIMIDGRHIEDGTR